MQKIIKIGGPSSKWDHFEVAKTEGGQKMRILWISEICHNLYRDRHILKNDLKKWGAGDPLNFSNFFAKIVFLVLLYKTVTKFLCKSTNFGYF